MNLYSLRFSLLNPGTCYETKPWVNPLTTRKVIVTPSGKGRHTVSRYITSQQYHPISHALPCRDEAGQLSTYWMIDLGEEHLLICNYYSIRSDSCKRGPQSWVLEASTDGDEWSVLREHINDHSMTQPARYHSWQVEKEKRQSVSHDIFQVFTPSLLPSWRCEKAGFFSESSISIAVTFAAGRQRDGPRTVPQV